MFSIAESKPHAARKRILANLYSKSSVQASANLHQASQALIYERLLPLLTSAASTGEDIDVLYLNASVAMDFVTAFLFGKHNGSNFIQESDEASVWLRHYWSRRVYFFWDAEFPSIIGWARRLGISLSPRFVDEATTYIGQITLDKCRLAERSANKLEMGTGADEVPQNSFDLLKKGLDDRPTSRGDEDVPDLRIASELHDSLIAGHDTTGIALVYLMCELSRHPTLQANLRTEFRDFSASIPFSPNGPQKTLPTPRLLDSLPLLHAVITETLRLHAPIPGPQPRKTPQTPTSIAGSPPLPPGVRISSQAYTLHRNGDVFPDPEAWRPSRWLDSSDEKKAEMNKWFWAFGSGSRGCIGRNLAMQGKS